ncbi:HEAT repeat domain-containing protein [Acidipila sp. EB88]|uniref:HEAT repeat domain-containing protein n=1 Tax=Acidipila sp. EB88 TaxID=2305226 RepID=UPI001315825D|nr:HEAT repeat domain-containing protein [Acidipila sp. EB88]
MRREALAGLQPFITQDMEVRDAVLAALMSDPSATVRIEAVRLLQPVDVDSSVRQVLHTVANQDGDPSIRSASLNALKNVPQIQ